MVIRNSANTQLSHATIAVPGCERQCCCERGTQLCRKRESDPAPQPELTTRALSAVAAAAPRGAGWVPDYLQGEHCKNNYATDDIFFLEVCLFNQMCTNGADLFALQAGEAFHCDFSAERVHELEQILTSPAAPEPHGTPQCDGRR